MALALKVLAACFASAAILMAVSVGTVVVNRIVPGFQELTADPRSTAILGLALGYLCFIIVVYSLGAWLIWRREKWSKALLLAVASCFGFPVGPLLGFAAIILLTRPQVKARFTS